MIVIVMFHWLISTTTTTTQILVGVEGFHPCVSHHSGGCWTTITTTGNDIAPYLSPPRRRLSQRHRMVMTKAPPQRSHDQRHDPDDDHDTDRVSHVLYLGHLDWTVTTTEWEHRIRHALFPWNVTRWNANEEDDTDDTRNETTHRMNLNLTFRPSTLRPRDVGKYHGGSVLLTFYDDDDSWFDQSRSDRNHPTTTRDTNQNDNHHLDRATRTAVAARQYLLQLQQQQQQQQDLEPPHWITPLRIQYHFVPPPSPARSAERLRRKVC